MDATNPSNASYAWKSILEGREVIKHGASWRIGTGTSVDIWGDNWLPTKNNPRIISPYACRGCHPIRLTTLLIVQRVWKEQVLDRYFFEFEAAVIKRIPLCQNSLPTKTNRVKRKVIAESVCDNCNQQEVDTAHALYHCSNLDNLWTSIPQWNHSNLKQSVSFIEMLGFVFAKNRNPELFISVIWAVWNRCNNLRLGKPVIPLSQLL